MFSLRACCLCCLPPIYLLSLLHQGVGDGKKGREQAHDLSMLICLGYRWKPTPVQPHQTCLEVFSKCHQLLYSQHPPLPNGELKLSLRWKGSRKGDDAILPSHSSAKSPSIHAPTRQNRVWKKSALLLPFYRWNRAKRPGGASQDITKMSKHLQR